MQSPFSTYPGGGRKLLGSPRSWDNCRHGYGLELQRRTGQTACAYCGIDLTNDYYHWLLMAVDHVVPSSVGKLLGIPPTFIGDCLNLVLTCSGCNSFHNRYTPTLADVPSEWTPEAFVKLRDAIFEERAALIEKRRAIEMTFFKSRPWESTA